MLSFFQWCADYPGFAQSALEQAHPGAVALFWAGCGADQNPLPRRTVELAQKYGRQLAEAAPQWAKRMHRVIRDLDQELVDYKGFTRYRDAMVTWLSQYDDGTPVDESLQQ